MTAADLSDEQLLCRTRLAPPRCLHVRRVLTLGQSLTALFSLNVLLAVRSLLIFILISTTVTRHAETLFQNFLLQLCGLTQIRLEGFGLDLLDSLYANVTVVLGTASRSPIIANSILLVLVQEGVLS